MTITLQNILKKKSELLLVKMQGLGIERNCRDWRQYIKAKRLAEYLSSSPDEYEFLIKIITNYLNI
jgi:hypothetical protein